MARVIITIPKNPTEGVKVEVTGCPGPGCQDLTANIEAALGSKTEDVQTDEYYVPHEDLDTVQEGF